MANKPGKGLDCAEGHDDTDSANLEELPNNMRRKLLTRSVAAAIGLGMLGLGVVPRKAIAKSLRSAAGGAGSLGSNGGRAIYKTSLNPAENPYWEGYENPLLRVKDGWDNWGLILNPDNLPIYHDRFNRIRYHDRTEFGRLGEVEKLKAPPHHWVMVIDVRKCIGCQACTVACKSENNVALGVYRTWVDVYQTGDTVPDPQGDIVVDGERYRQEVQVHAVPKLCNHCDDPPCVEVCPVKATYKREDGIVLVDHRLCIGCGTCVNACPYNARYIDPISNTADKCTFCVERVDAGLLPACVTTCTGRARIFGDLQDPSSEVSRLLADHAYTRRHVEYGTDPQVYYIGRSGDVDHEPDPDVHHMVFTYTSNSNNSVVKNVVNVI